LHFSDWVFPDAHLTVENKAPRYKHSDEVPTKVFHADKTIPAFHGWQVHTVNRYQSAGHDDPMELIDEIGKMLLKFSVILAVSHVPVTV
jgi:hypothetical protein